MVKLRNKQKQHNKTPIFERRYEIDSSSWFPLFWFNPSALMAGFLFQGSLRILDFSVQSSRNRENHF